MKIKIHLSNPNDYSYIKKGNIHFDKVRQWEGEAVINTKVNMLVLPKWVANILGIVPYSFFTIEAAENLTEYAGIGGPVKIDLNGKTAKADCLIFNDEREIVIGRIPLTDLNVSLENNGIDN